MPAAVLDKASEGLSRAAPVGRLVVGAGAALRLALDRPGTIAGRRSKPGGTLAATVG